MVVGFFSHQPPAAPCTKPHRTKTCRNQGPKRPTPCSSRGTSEGAQLGGGWSPGSRIHRGKAFHWVLVQCKNVCKNDIFLISPQKKQWKIERTKTGNESTLWIEFTSLNKNDVMTKTGPCVNFVGAHLKIPCRAAAISFQGTGVSVRKPWNTAMNVLSKLLMIERNPAQAPFGCIKPVVNIGINYLPTGAGFLPSTVSVSGFPNIYRNFNRITSKIRCAFDLSRNFWK